MGRFSPTVRPDYYGPRYNEISEAFEFLYNAKRQAEYDKMAKERHGQRQRAGDVEAWESGWREGEPVGQAPPLPADQGGPTINEGGGIQRGTPRIETPVSAGPAPQRAQQPSISLLPHQLPGAVGGVPGSFDPATGEFQKYVPLESGGYLDPSQTPTARSRREAEEARRALEAAVAAAGARPERADVLSREPSLIREELYPDVQPSKGYQPQTFEESYRLRHGRRPDERRPGESGRTFRSPGGFSSYDDALEQSEFLAQRFEELTNVPVPAAVVEENARRMYQGKRPEWPEVPTAEEDEGGPGWLSRAWATITSPFRGEEGLAEEGPPELEMEGGLPVITQNDYEDLRDYGLSDEEIEQMYSVPEGIRRR
jgi:hypothetical protein